MKSNTINQFCQEFNAFAKNEEKNSLGVKFEIGWFYDLFPPDIIPNYFPKFQRCFQSAIEIGSSNDYHSVTPSRLSTLRNSSRSTFTAWLEEFVFRGRVKNWILAEFLPNILASVKFRLTVLIKKKVIKILETENIERIMLRLKPATDQWTIVYSELESMICLLSWSWCPRRTPSTWWCTWSLPGLVVTLGAARGAVCQNTPSPDFSSGHLRFFPTPRTFPIIWKWHQQKFSRALSWQLGCKILEIIMSHDKSAFECFSATNVDFMGVFMDAEG